MNEAPAASSDAPDDRNDLLPIVLLSDIRPPFVAYFHVHFSLGAQKPEGGIKSSER